MPDGLPSSQLISSLSNGGNAAATGQPWTIDKAIGSEGQVELGGDPMGFFKGKLGGEGLEGFGAKGLADMINDSNMVKTAIGSEPGFNKGSPGINVQPPTVDFSVQAGLLNKGGSGQGHG